MEYHIIKPLKTAFTELSTHGKISNSIALEIMNNFNNMLVGLGVRDKGKRKDYSQQTFVELLQSLRSNKSLWEDVFIHKEKDNNQIRDYVFEIIKTAIGRASENGSKKILINFFRHFNNAINKLLCEKFLREWNKKLIHISVRSKCAYDGNYEKITDFYNVFNSNGTLNFQLIKNAIVSLFKNYLKNCFVLRSHLKEILKFITNVKTYETPLDFPWENDEDSLSPIEKIDGTIENPLEMEIEDEANHYAGKSIRTALRNLGGKNFNEYGKIFLLRFNHEMKLEEISQKLNITKSLIEYRLNRFRSAAEFIKLPNMDKNSQAAFLRAFIEKLKEKINVELG